LKYKAAEEAGSVKYLKIETIMLKTWLERCHKLTQRKRMPRVARASQIM
jgi:hypothetical protein